VGQPVRVCGPAGRPRFPHKHTTTNGGFHFTAGEVCDDIGQMQIERGKNISMAAFNQKSLEVIERIDQ